MIRLLGALVAFAAAQPALAQGIVRVEPQAFPAAARFPIAYVPTRHGLAFVTERGVEVGGRVLLAPPAAELEATRRPEIVAVFMANGQPGLLVLQIPAEAGCAARHAVLDVAAAPPVLSDTVPSCTTEIAVRASGATVTLLAPPAAGAQHLRIWIVEGGRIRRG